MFAELDAELRSAHAAAGRSPSTTAQYRTVLRLFGQHLAASRSTGLNKGNPLFDLDDLTARDVEDFLAEARRRASPATARTYFLVLRAVFNFAVRRGLLVSNPTAVVAAPRAERKVRAVLSPEDVSRLVTGRPTRSPFLDARDTAILALLAGSGLRRSEICRLQFADLDQTEGVVVIRVSKTGRGRVVPYDDRTRVALRRWLRTRGAGPEGALFTSRATGLALTPSALTQMVRARADSVGLEYERAVHALRHYAADRWLSAGMSDGNVMALGGWTSPTMITSVYGAGRRTERAIEAYRKLGS